MNVLASLRQLARELGFVHVGIAPAVEPAGFSRLVDWIRDGRAGEMHYLSERLAAYRHPSSVLDGARTLVMLTLPYPAGASPPSRDGTGRVARYVWSGDDYHDVVHAKLKRMAGALSELAPGCRVRGVVDTAPLLEREFASLAGIGWQGKNTLLINKFAGSYFFLACLLTDLDLPIDQPHNTQHCGTCRRCLDACPTDAFPEPGVLDATRCISYLTIEHRGSIPRALRPGIGDWLFGCDVCQEVCPWNRPKRPRPDVAGPAAERDGLGSNGELLRQLDLRDLFWMDEDEFRQRFRKTPLWRARRRGLLRNAAIVLGNQRDSRAVAALRHGVCDVEPLVRGASAWAIGEIGDGEDAEFLKGCLDVERDEDVRDELRQALSRLAARRRGDG